MCLMDQRTLPLSFICRSHKALLASELLLAANGGVVNLAIYAATSAPFR